MPNSSVTELEPWHQAGGLSDRDFHRLAQFVEAHAGIRMPPSKKTMLEGRLRRRVAATGCHDFADYVRYLFERDGLAQETVPLIDLVTTNKTDFFREADHFHYLTETALPALTPWRRPGRQGMLKVWSAAASTGAEAYTLAMVLADAAERHGNFDFSILGTDISTRVLHAAALAIFSEDMATPIPPALRKRYLLRSRDPGRQLVRVVPGLRRRTHFRQLNLMDAEYPVEHDMEVIFLRNVLIYFDRPTQQAVLQRLCTHLVPGGYLFLGHSETVAGQYLPLTPVGPTIFRRN